MEISSTSLAASPVIKPVVSSIIEWPFSSVEIFQGRHLSILIGCLLNLIGAFLYNWTGYGRFELDYLSIRNVKYDISWLDMDVGDFKLFKIEFYEVQNTHGINFLSDGFQFNNECLKSMLSGC